jgi:signal transduction histidine kinase
MVDQNPAGEKCVHSIMRSSRRLNRMIEDILTVTKLERGSVTLQQAPLEAGALLARVLETYSPEMAQKNINFYASPAAGKIEFSGDGPLLERVVGTLVGNAVKFVPQGATISLACAETPDGVRFQVEDTGPGIPEDKREVIFDKYVQMEEHATFGFGLGLAMCRMAVELHKGRIWVESVVGAGSKFIFVIPKSAAAPAAGGEASR